MTILNFWENNKINCIFSCFSASRPPRVCWCKLASLYIRGLNCIFRLGAVLFQIQNAAKTCYFSNHEEYQIGVVCQQPWCISGQVLHQIGVEFYKQSLQALNSLPCSNQDYLKEPNVVFTKFIADIYRPINIFNPLFSLDLLPFQIRCYCILKYSISHLIWIMQGNSIIISRKLRSCPNDMVPIWKWKILPLMCIGHGFWYSISTYVTVLAKF